MLRAKGHDPHPWRHSLSANEDNVADFFLHPAFAYKSNSTFIHSLFEVGAHQPVSPTLQCITGLTIFFFTVYLLIIIIRLAKTIARFTKRDLGPWPESCEAALIKGTDALAPAPMLCILLAATRLRAMQLDPSRGDPQWWVQMCMYIGTSAFFVRFLVYVAYGAAGTSATQLHCHAVLVFRTVASVFVYSCCGAIVVGMLIMRAPGSADPPAFPVAISCVVFLTVAYFAEFMTIEAAAVSNLLQNPLQSARDSIEKETGGSATKEKAQAAALHFPPMLCVLLVGIELRAFQLHLEPALWASAAMIASTLSLVGQVILAGVNELRVTKSQQPLQKMDGVVGRATTISQLALMSILLLTTGLTLVSVFAMEERPLAVLSPEMDDAVQEAMNTHDKDNNPPLSAAMRCVTLLTVLYFSVKLWLLTAGLLFNPLQAWAADVLATVESALVFTPMLCVMMVGVRLRALQLHIADPQEWAQSAMYVATFAVLVQVVCCFVEALSDSDKEEDEDNKTLAQKVATILVIVFKHLASATLYVSVATLIVALFTMEPGATHAR